MKTFKEHIEFVVIEVLIASIPRFAQELWIRTYEILQEGYLLKVVLGYKFSSCSEVLLCQRQPVSEHRWEASWPMIQIGVFSKKSNLEL